MRRQEEGYTPEQEAVQCQGQEQVHVAGLCLVYACVDRREYRAGAYQEKAGAMGSTALGMLC